MEYPWQHATKMAQLIRGRISFGIRAAPDHGSTLSLEHIPLECIGICSTSLVLAHVTRLRGDMPYRKTGIHLAFARSMLSALGKAPRQKNMAALELDVMRSHHRERRAWFTIRKRKS
jgi:hypothetical protein